MSDIEFRQKLAELTARIAIMDAQVMANPKKYLEEMSAHANRLIKVLDDVEYALSPDMVYDFWELNCDHSAIPRPQDLNGEAMIRCNAAKDVLRRYRISK